MRVKDKTEAIFVRGVVIACGESDVTGDAPVDRESVKKIFSNYLTQNTDVQHSWVPNIGVYVLENTITTGECVIADQQVPTGSWISSMMITNPDIKTMVEEEDINGFSLGAVGEKGLNENQDFLNKALRYEDLVDAEDLNPMFISLVNKPANGYRLEVMDYNEFLAKSCDYELDKTIIDDNVMTEKIIENNDNNSMGIIESLTEVLKFALTKSDDEKEEDNEPVEVELEKSEEEKEEEVEETLEKDDDISNAELLEKLPGAVAEAVISALQAYAESQAEPLEKDEGSDEGGQSEEGESETTTESEDESTEEVDDACGDGEECKLKKNCDGEELEKSNGKFNKSERLEKSTEKSIPTKQEKMAKKSTFLNSEKRDMFGRNRKYL